MNNFKLSPMAKEIIEWTYCIVIAVALAILVRYFLGTPTVVKQPSMYPTLKQNQRLILNKIGKTLKKSPQKGDIVTFEAPSTPYIPANEANLDEPIAIYNYNFKNAFQKFLYYVLEINKISYIKRVIAVSGEHVKIQEGKVFINGEKLEEPYLQEGIITDSLNGAFVDIIVPEGCVFVMGDNRRTEY